MTEPQNQPNTIRELKAGETITSFFVIRKKELKTKKDQTPYLLLDLGDPSGRIPATLWENAQAVYDAVQVGNIVKVKGTIMTYKDAPQISVQKIRKAEPSDNVDTKAFVPQGKLDIDDLTQRLTETIESVKNPFLRHLLDRIFHDPVWLSRFREAPGGKLWHHAYLGGLLEHTLAVVEVCETMTRLYPTAQRDLLITGALLHDIGKIEEYRYDQGFIEYSDEGRLWGHISIGAQRIRVIVEEFEKGEGFPPELKKHLLHLVLSHQGKLEHGSPVVPMTLEAMILYYADEVDSKANALVHIMERDEEPGRQWSRYTPVLERFIYMGDRETEKKEDEQPKH